MSMRVCAENAINAEFTLCGDAFDAFASGDADEEHECAEPGGVITCPNCCKIIKDLRESRYKLKPRSEWTEAP